MKKMFVYGTLRVGMYNYEKYYKGYDSFRGYGYVKGTLHTLKGKNYPALTPGEHMILGEIHEVPDEVQDEVDRMEGFFGEGNPENEYDKTVSVIYDDGGKILDYLPVYFYNMKNPENRELLGDIIICCDYVSYMENSGRRIEK